MISQPHSSETSRGFDSRNYHSQAIFENTRIPISTAVPTNVGSYRHSLVGNISQASPLMTWSDASSSYVTYVPSPIPFRYSILAPVLSFAGLLPVMQLNLKVQNKTCLDRMSCSYSLASMSSKHGSTDLNTAHESSAPNRGSIQPQKVSIDKTDRTLVNYSENLRSTLLKSEKDENLWPGTCKYGEFEQNPGSALFVTWFGSTSLLVGKLRYHKLEARYIKRTSDDQVLNVVFDSHAKARKAFTTQRIIGLRMIPPKSTQFKWFKNPSPGFLVKFEIKCPLIIRKGKASSQNIVGELLPYNCNEQKRCFVWADQIKGYSIRIVGCQGNLKHQDGRVVKMPGISSKFEGGLKKGNKIPALGWIPYRCTITKDMFVTRLTGNLLSDYIFRG